MSRRIQGNLEITCELNSVYFEDWENLTDEQRAVFDTRRTRCNGEGNMGPWCLYCDFCTDADFEDYGAIPEES